MPIRFFFLNEGTGFFTIKPNWDCRAEAYLYTDVSRIGCHQNNLLPLQYHCIDSIAGRGYGFFTTRPSSQTTDGDLGHLTMTPCCEERGKVPL